MNATGNNASTTREKSGLSKEVVADALAGEGKKLTTLWEIVATLVGDEERCIRVWPYLFRFDSNESQFRRAVLNGDSDAAR